MNSKNLSTAVFITPADGSELLPDEGVLYWKMQGVYAWATLIRVELPRGSRPIAAFCYIFGSEGHLAAREGKIEGQPVRIHQPFLHEFSEGREQVLVHLRQPTFEKWFDVSWKNGWEGGRRGILLESMRLFLPNCNRYCEFTIWHFCEGGHETLLQLRRPINMELERRECQTRDGEEGEDGLHFLTCFLSWLLI